MTESEPDPFAVVARMDGLAVQLLWPRFDPRQIPVALSTRDETLLFRHPNPPPEFASVSDALGALSFRGLHPSLRANTSVDLGGVPTATIMLDTLEQLSLTEIAAVVIHEVFHIFQHIHHPDWSADEMALFVYPLTISSCSLRGISRLQRCGTPWQW